MSRKRVTRKTPKYRALELYTRDTPFRQKIVQSKKAYSRKVKFKNDECST